MGQPVAVSAWCAERIGEPGWAGLPLAHLVPAAPDHPGPACLPLRDTLFVWRGDALRVSIQSQDGRRCALRHAGSVDLVAEDHALAPAEAASSAARPCLLVCLSPVAREPFEAGLHGHGALRTRLEIVDPLLYELATGLERHCLGGQALGPLYSEALSTALVAHVRACHFAPTAGRRPADARPAGAGPLDATQMAWIHRHIRERLAGEIRLRDLAAGVGYSQAHFSRLFRRTLGVTPHRYVLQMRVDHAKRLLHDEQLSLGQVASACGFADQSHFGTAFTRLTGTPPGRFRAARRKRSPDRAHPGPA